MNEKAIVSAALVLALISCHHATGRRKPPIQIQAPGYFLFLEEANLQDVLRVLDGSVELDCSGPNGGMCTMTGEGEVSIQGHRCHVSPQELSCNGVLLDLSLGGVLMRRNGQIVPVNPLPTLAR